MTFFKQVIIPFLLIAAFISFFFVGVSQVQAADLNVLHEFVGGVTDGAQPNGDLVRDGSVLYGMTSIGGDDDVGVIFSVNTDGSNMTILHEFAGSPNDGSSPYGSLIQNGSVLYGMTFGGGGDFSGTIFSINTNGTGFTILHEFAGGANDGANPLNSLVIEGSVLYGMTEYGGDDNEGTIFSINTNGTGFTLLHEFAGGVGDGAQPDGSLLKDGSVLYGMTFIGGTNNSGIIFSINTNGTGYTILHEFAHTTDNGAQPYRNSLIQNGSVLYGMTWNGGEDDVGVIFSINKNGTGFTLLHEFVGGVGDGSLPEGDLLLIDSTLYGMTSSGGDWGTIFSIDTDGSDYTLIHEFSGEDEGGTPKGSLIYDGSTFYGMTSADGDDNYGAVFSFSLSDPTPTPTPSPGSQSNSSGSSSNDSSAPSCTDSKPSGMPDLFQIDVSNTQATLYFTAVSGANKYYINYGTGTMTNQHGSEFDMSSSAWIYSYTINRLSPNTEYSFVVRGGNGCMPGEWGNTMTVKTRSTSQGGASFYKSFGSKILSIFPKQVTNAGSGNNVLELRTPSVIGCQDYIVKSGDSLWTIASQNLGSGTLYSEIMQKNSLKSTSLNIGQVLKVGC